VPGNSPPNGCGGAKPSPAGSTTAVWAAGCGRSYRTGEPATETLRPLTAGCRDRAGNEESRAPLAFPADSGKIHRVPGERDEDLGPNSLREFLFDTLRFACQRPFQRYLSPIAVVRFPADCLAKALFRGLGLYVKADGQWMFVVLFSRSG
jgi:hypothetical protein